MPKFFGNMNKKLSDTINRKFTETINITDYEVETDTGFVDIVSINKTIPYLKYIIKTSNGKELECADDHILFTEDLEEKFAKNFVIGEKIYTIDGIEVVTDVINTNEYEEMYDLALSDDSNHRYYTNGIISHNTLIAKKSAEEISLQVLPQAMLATRMEDSSPRPSRISSTVYSYWMKSKRLTKRSIIFSYSCLMREDLQIVLDKLSTLRT